MPQLTSRQLTLVWSSDADRRSKPHRHRARRQGGFVAGSLLLLCASLLRAQVVVVELRVAPHPTADEALQLPSSVRTVCVGQELVLEIWVRNLGTAPPGIAGGTVHIGYSGDVVAAISIDSGSVFDLLTTGWIDSSNALVLNVGGATFDEGVATPPTWALLSRVFFTAVSEGDAMFEAGAGMFPFALSGGRPPLSDAEISYGLGPVVRVSVIRVFGDGDCDDDVDLEDYLRVETCLAGPGSSPEACALFDSDGDGDVDLVDIADVQTSFSGEVP